MALTQLHIRSPVEPLQNLLIRVTPPLSNCLLSCDFVLIWSITHFSGQRSILPGYLTPKLPSQDSLRCSFLFLFYRSEVTKHSSCTYLPTWNPTGDVRGVLLDVMCFTWTAISSATWFTNQHHWLWASQAVSSSWLEVSNIFQLIQNQPSQGKNEYRSNAHSPGIKGG